MQTIKAYIIYGGQHQFWSATLVFENGWAAFSHCCSDPYYMPGDLWNHRPERQEILREMGYEVEIIGEPIKGSDNSPAGLIEAHKDESRWKEMSEQYKALKAARKADV